MKNKKKSFIAFLFILFIFITPICQNVSAENENDSYGEYIEDLIQSVDYSSLDEFFLKYYSIFDNADGFENILKKYLASTSSDYGNIFSYFMQSAKESLKSFATSFFVILVIAIMSGLISSLSPNLSSSAKEAVFLSCYLCGASVLFGETATLISEIFAFVQELIGLMQSVIPIFITLSTISGNTAKAQNLTPVCGFITQSVSVVSVRILMPAVAVVCALNVAGSISEKYSLSKTRDFIIGAFKWLTGIVITLLSFFTALSGISGSVKDGVSMRALKYTVGNAVPIIGGFAREGVDVVIAAAQTVKGGIGVVFLLMLSVVCIKPILKIIIFSLGLKLLAALSAPFADNRFCDMLIGFKKTVSLLAVILISTLIMFFFLIYTILFMQVG